VFAALCALLTCGFSSGRLDRGLAVRRQGPLFEHLVDQAEGLGLVGGEEFVALDILLDLLERLAGIMGHELVHPVADAQDLAGLDLDVASHALGAAGRLVDHDPRVGERDPHARLAGGEQEGAHRGGLADADGADLRPDILHGVVDRHAGRHHPARRVDVDIDVLLRILALEVEQLGGDQGRHMVLDPAGDEHDPLPEQPRIDVEAALAAVRLLDDDRHELVGDVFMVHDGGRILDVA